MKKKVMISLMAATLLVSNASAASMYDRLEAMEKEINKLKAEIADLKAKESASMKAENKKIDVKETPKNDKEDLSEKLADIQESIDDLHKKTGGNHLKFNVDLRSAVENIQYKMADGSTNNNDAFFTNRLWLGMNWAATDNLSFTGQLAYNKAYGSRSGASTNNSFENFDWITNENAYDDTIRVRSAYFFYKNNTFLGTDIPWTFSLGRRPSTNGHLVNLRDDDLAASPMGHTINVEFDGLSSKFDLERMTGVSGMYVKFCAGRGGTNAQPKFSGAPYSKDTNSINDIDLAGLIFVPYDDGQYSIGTQFYYANNLIDENNASDPSAGFKNVGGLYSGTVNFVVNGIGDGISDFLDYTLFFISGAVSQTNPKSGQTMLGSPDAKTGHSEWIGVQFPSLISNSGRWGLEYNHGSKYWRSITYAEDTNIGSKLAARGNAYEAYFTEPLIRNILSLQLRYTYIDYDYSGSNGFFGSETGTPMTMSEAVANGHGSEVVDKAQDIRFYLRYRY
ncbi:DUF3373 family protein [Sulfurimonas sp. HSL-1716]|uniref:DUF3373 family protein n=1 Tax=Hydrocurvibacter sulfurireducens TaxID=3131937 RepID=UPI0031F76A0D